MKQIAQLFCLNSQRWYYIRHFNIFAGFPDAGLSLEENQAKTIDEWEARKMKYHYKDNVRFMEIEG